MKRFNSHPGWIALPCVLSMVIGHAMAQAQWPRLDCYDDVPDEEYVPLLSQCGIRVAYVAILASGHSASLAELVHSFRGDLEAERDGLSVGQIVELIRSYGGDCEPARLGEEGFSAIPFSEYVLVVLLTADSCHGHSGHYEVILGRDGDEVLLTRWGESPRWVQGEDVKAVMAGPVIAVRRGRSMSSDHGWCWGITIGSAGVLVLCTAVYVISRKRRVRLHGKGISTTWRQASG